MRYFGITKTGWLELETQNCVICSQIEELTMENSCDVDNFSTGGALYRDATSERPACHADQNWYSKGEPYCASGTWKKRKKYV